MASRRSVLLAAAFGLPAAVAGCARPTSSQAMAMAAEPKAPVEIRGAPTTRSEARGRLAYGPDASQWGEFSVPRTLVSRGVVVIIHGGFWLAEYGAELGTPLAADFFQRGYATWNLEYRRIGNGGGWPQTFQDVAAGIDHLRAIAPTAGLDLQKVVAIGHSAGGQLATWAAGRRTPSIADPHAATRVRLAGVVSQAGVLDLAGAAREHLGGDATQQLLGGQPAQVPGRYTMASPQEMLPNRVPVWCVHSRSDRNVPYAQSVNYVAAARKVGAVACLDTVPGDHFSLITVGTPAWEATVRRTVELLR